MPLQPSPAVPAGPVVLGAWERLPRPFSVLAPMEEVTDTVFRRLVRAAGAPDLFFTEFTSTDGLCSRGRPRVIGRLRYTEEERPLIAQIWGTKPENYLRVAAEVRGMGFDGIDINMGCPVPKVVRRGACAGLIGNTSLAAELIAAAREGAAGLPVSVKTRIGIAEPDPEPWLSFLLAQGLSALTVHGRTAAQQSEGAADWGAVALAVRLRDEAGVPTLVVGNGDVRTAEAFHRRARESGADGIMVGRGIFEDLHVFAAIRGGDGHSFSLLPVGDKIAAFRRHLVLHRDTWGAGPGFHALKKFAKTYLRAFDGAHALVETVMRTHSHDEAVAALDAWLARHDGGAGPSGPLSGPGRIPGPGDAASPA